jgi:hypothetical protein
MEDSDDGSVSLEFLHKEWRMNSKPLVVVVVVVKEGLDSKNRPRPDKK